MKLRHCMAAILVFSLFSVALACAQQNAEQLYQAAVYKEEVQGELDQAIAIFEQIVSEFPGSRSVVARALLHCGLCYEKLGRQDAQKAYQRILREYADQQEAAAEARTRLDALEQAVSDARPQGLLVRKVQADSTVCRGGAVSPDGRFISYTERETGDLAVYEPDSGKKRRLTDNGTGKDCVENAEESRWSPDGTQLVYSWCNNNKTEESYDLRIIALDGSKPRILYKNAEKYEYVAPGAWFPDGRHILAVIYKNMNTSQIVKISCADGSIAVLKTFAEGPFWASLKSHISLSPDGRTIAYNTTPQDSSSNHDIFLLAADGSSEIPLDTHRAHDYVLGWAPDGKRMLFASDRNGTLDAFLINIVDGKPQGAPVLVKTNIGPVVPLGFTRTGSFYYSYNEGYSDIYTTEIDPQTGRILKAAQKAIDRYEGYNTLPEFSPDGKYLAYVSKRGLACLGNVLSRNGNVLCIRSLETGKDRELFLEGLNNFHTHGWSPDSRYIFVVNRKTPGKREGTYRIDTYTGEVTLVVTLEQYLCANPQCSHDGKSLFLVRYDNTKDCCSIVVRDFENGLEKEIYRESTGEIIGQLSISPDGQWLAFNFQSEDTTSQQFTSILKVISVTGGESRELYKGIARGAVVWCPKWTADGKYILFCSRPEKESDKESDNWALWRVPAAGGEPRKIGLEKFFWHLSAHSDGRRIAVAITGDRRYNYSGIWVMENFLPDQKP